MLFLKNPKKICITGLHYAVNLLDLMLNGKCLKKFKKLSALIKFIEIIDSLAYILDGRLHVFRNPLKLMLLLIFCSP